jgi:putative beta-lysine N-acetyltransferase
MMSVVDPDKVLSIGNSLIQYGNYNKRVYLLHVEKDDVKSTLEWINSKVHKLMLSKVIGKIPQDCKDIFKKQGYRIEASIPNFYHNKGACYFMASYFNDPKRKNEPRQELLSSILSTAKSKTNQSHSLEINNSYGFRLMQKMDAKKMASLYRSVFPSYPFPIFDQDYLLQTMEEEVDYFGIFYKNDLIALSSIEKSSHTPTAEMTDFATLPPYRGKGLAGFLLHEMEKYAKLNYHFQTIYTIARAYSYGINTIFSKAGYSYGGTLTNNTNIHGQIESMNIWHKTLNA